MGVETEFDWVTETRSELHGQETGRVYETESFYSDHCSGFGPLAGGDMFQSFEDLTYERRTTRTGT